MTNHEQTPLERLLDEERDKLRAEVERLRAEVTRLRIYAPGRREEHKIRMAPVLNEPDLAFWGIEETDHA